MAVCRIRKSNDGYIALSGDVKPIVGIEMGTILTELDTGARYIFYKGAWEDDLTLIYAIKQAMGL